MKQCTAQLQREHTQRGDRPTYWPSRLVEDCAQLCVEPLAWQGSADLRTLADANCLTYFPAGEQRFAAGEVVQVYLL